MTDSFVLRDSSCCRWTLRCNISTRIYYAINQRDLLNRMHENIKYTSINTLHYNADNIKCR